jgi:hypothetical protein
MSFINQGKTNWKFLIIIIFFALLAGGSIFVYTKQQDAVYYVSDILSQKNKKNTATTSIESVTDIPDWQIYRNEEYGFELKYPGTLSNDCNIQKKEGNILVGDKIELIILDPKGLTLDDYYAQLLEKIGKTGVFADGYTEFIAGIRVKGFTYYLDKVWTKTFILLYNGNIYKFDYKDISSSCNYGEGGDVNIYYRIVTSLRFTDEISKVIENFCKKYDPPFDYKKISYINADEDAFKEFIGLCQRKAVPADNSSPDDIKYLLFILDKDKQGNYIPIMEVQGGEHQRYYKFADFEIKDLDEDGIEEVITKEIGWYSAGSNTKIEIYSPKYNDWFWGNFYRDCSDDYDNCKTEVTYSEDLNQNHNAFKEFLSEEIKK